MNKILLTGATGFIGSHVLEALTDAGLPVAALVRPLSNSTCQGVLPAEIRLGDIRDPASLRAAMQGCSQVIHVAGLATDWARREEFLDTNVRGTLNVLEACRQEKIQHVVMTGSISSYGEEDSCVPKDERSPFKSHYPYLLDRLFPCGMNGYRDSKAEATKQAMAFARRHGMNLTVLEPVWVYGEREFGTGFYSYVKSVQDGQRWMPGSDTNLFHAIYAGDLARAYVLAAVKQQPGVERFIVGPPAAEPMAGIFGLFCDEAGLARPRFLPKWSVYPIGFGLELLYTLARRRHPPLLTRGRVNMFYDSIQYSIGKARSVLGFECRFTLDQGVRRTVAWYRQNGWLTGGRAGPRLYEGRRHQPQRPGEFESTAAGPPPPHSRDPLRVSRATGSNATSLG